MDSLLANYASSDEEGEEKQPPQPQQQRRQQQQHQQQINETKKPASSSITSLFSSIPKPKQHHQPISDLLPPPVHSNPNPKRVVQFSPNVPLNSVNSDEDDEDEDNRHAEEKERKRQRNLAYSSQPSSVSSFLSSIPAPRNSSSLGVAGSGRRSIVENEAPVSSIDPIVSKDDGGGGESYSSGFTENGANSYADYSGYAALGNDDQNVGQDIGSNYGWSYDGDCNYGHYHGNNVWGEASANAMSQVTESEVRLPEKRGRKENPAEIVEVKQDDLVKNRPREDQSRLTGIAFGPSYQPTSTKGKPTKLHKRKHQIGSLYFDMKQKEMELAERRSRGFLTKAQTQGKYGW